MILSTSSLFFSEAICI